jgi:hypothetical protein
MRGGVLFGSGEGEGVNPVIEIVELSFFEQFLGDHSNIIIPLLRISSL